MNPKCHPKDPDIYIGEAHCVKQTSTDYGPLTDCCRNLIITSHQFTAKETGASGSQRYPSEIWLRRLPGPDFAMKVLDEGIDIPQTDTAFLMASSTVEREWIQRRGRILAQRSWQGCSQTSMTFIVVLSQIPPHLRALSLLRSELRRASAFADLAENEYDPDGPRTLIRNLESSI